MTVDFASFSLLISYLKPGLQSAVERWASARDAILWQEGQENQAQSLGRAHVPRTLQACAGTGEPVTAESSPGLGYPSPTATPA